VNKLEFWINKGWCEGDITDELFDIINKVVDRPNSDMIGEDCVRITVEFYKEDEQ